MSSKIHVVQLCLVSLVALATLIISQGQENDDPVRELVDRLELESYKNTIWGLAQFGDRRQGTERNRRAVDWIEQQFEELGCSPERLHYIYNPEPSPPRTRRPQPNEHRDLTTPTGGQVGRNGVGPGGASIYGYRANGG